MRSSSIQELKQELSTLKTGELTTLCLRLARFKKENKELLTYLLFEAHDEENYIREVKAEVEELFGTINLSHLYFAKKTLRKILRVINKFSRYSGNKQTDLELRIFFCRQLHDSGIPFKRNTVISNLYDGQLKKIYAVLHTLHEDLQHDYSKEIDLLAAK
jgi:hypothetical protein